MERAFGKQGFTVPALGFGAGHIGDPQLDEGKVGTLLNQVLDLGMTFIDTARSYGKSEERIGRHLSHRRQQFVLSTKVGYGIPGYDDWTYDCILAGVESALKLLRTDYLDIVHLHSCPLEILQHGDVILALHKARDQGKLRVIGYSGENIELLWAIKSGQFGSVECSVNLFDQRCIEQALPMAQKCGMGVIAKRPLANAPWRFAMRPKGEYVEEYWARWKKMGIETHGMDWQELALRFAANVPAVCTAIVGTTSAAHLLQNKIYADQGPLQDEWFELLRQSFRQHDDSWDGQI